MDMTDSQKKGLRLVRAVRHEFGEEKGLELFDAMKAVLGTKWASAIIFNIMNNAITNCIRIVKVNENDYINTIKMIRQYSGLGLKDAKDIADAVKGGTPQLIDLSRSNDTEIERFVHDMQMYGNVVEYA